MTVAAPDSTLAAIQKKVRRLTQNTSANLLTDDQLNEYINTFVVYDFPEHLRMFNQHITFTFETNAYQDVYYTDTASYGSASNATANPLYDFQNKYISLNAPVYIGGYNSMFSQSREQFFAIYPMTNSIQSIGQTGNGSKTSFSGNILLINGQTSNSAAVINTQNACIVKNQVLFTSIDINQNSLARQDFPLLDSVTGNPTQWGLLVATNVVPTAPILITAPYNNLATLQANNPSLTFNNIINYTTGDFTVTFNIAPGVGQPVVSQTLIQAMAIPQTMLFYGNQITMRPVPDQSYRVNFEVYMRPTYLMETNQFPQLNEWWQYIAYGAAKKVFEDKLDMDSVNLIMPEFKVQETLVLRRTLVQLNNQRAATIYTEQSG
ncbi:MAG TPA: hypothetical protein VNZ45_09695, partial [Bacteroidia bacterium]|nr:hypothetical protein [Bacteroidia bacterium]